MLNKIVSILRQVLFFGAALLALLAILEKLSNLFGYTFLREYYTSWRLLEFAAIALLFVIVLQLWEINNSLNKKE